MEQFSLASISNKEYFNNLLEIIKLPFEDYAKVLKEEKLSESDFEGKVINRTYIELELKSFFANAENCFLDDNDNWLIYLIDFSYRQPIKSFIEKFIKPALDGKIEYREYSIIEIYDILQRYKDDIFELIDN